MLSLTKRPEYAAIALQVRTLLLSESANDCTSPSWLVRERSVLICSPLLIGQRMYRGRRDRRQFVKTKTAAIVLQHAWRQYAKNKAAKHRCSQAAESIQRWWRSTRRAQTQPPPLAQPQPITSSIAACAAVSLATEVPSTLPRQTLIEAKLRELREKRRQIEDRLRVSARSVCPHTSNESDSVHSRAVSPSARPRPPPMVRQGASFNLFAPQRQPSDESSAALPALLPSRLPRRSYGFAAARVVSTGELEHDACKELDRETRLNTARNSTLCRVDNDLLSSGPALDLDLPVQSVLRWCQQLTTYEPSTVTTSVYPRSILRQRAAVPEELESTDEH
jgi:hypothetical protein